MVKGSLIRHPAVVGAGAAALAALLGLNALAFARGLQAPWLLGGVLLTIDGAVRQRLDRWLPRAALPGVGLLATLTLITLVGFLGSHFFTRRLVQAFGALLERVPVVKMLFSTRLSAV